MSGVAKSYYVLTECNKGGKQDNERDANEGNELRGQDRALPFLYEDSSNSETECKVVININLNTLHIIFS